MRCVIFAGGPIEDYGGVLLQAGDMVLCADSGARHARALGAVPHLIIGDMDSVDPCLLEEFSGRGCRVCRFSVEKDEVDTELALNAAIASGPDEIVIYGATGGRLDHTLANVHLLAAAARQGITSSIVDHLHRIMLVTPELPASVERRGSTFTLLPLTSKVTGVVTRGAAWELDGAEFELGKPYGVSNVVKDERVRISVGEGMLLLIELLTNNQQPMTKR